MSRRLWCAGMRISPASRPAAPKSPPVRIGFMSHRSSSRDRLSRLAGARPAQGQPWQGRQISFRLPLRNISTEAEPLFRPKGKGPTPPTDHYEAHESNRIGRDSSAHGSAPNCQIAKKDKRRPGVARQGPGGPLWSTHCVRKARWKEHVCCVRRPLTFRGDT